MTFRGRVGTNVALWPALGGLAGCGGAVGVVDASLDAASDRTIGATEAGEVDSTTPNDAGPNDAALDGPDCSPVGPQGDGAVGPFAPPNPPESVCTMTQIETLYDDCYAPDASSTECDAFYGDPTNSPCIRCMISDSTDNSWGPVVNFGNAGLQANIGGCIALVDQDAGPGGCGAAEERYLVCYKVACTTDCPTFNECFDEAIATVCAQYVDAAQCAQKAPYDGCIFADFEAYFRGLGQIFCAAGTDGTGVSAESGANEGGTNETDAGATITTLASGQGPSYGIAVDSQNVYWTAFDTGNVMRVSIDGGSPTVIASGQVNPYGIAVDSQYVYWTNNNSAGTVMRAPLEDGGSPTMLAADQNGPNCIAVDDTRVYWTAYYDGTVMAVPLYGGNAVALAAGQAQPYGIVVGEASVYWTNSTSVGAVLQVPDNGGSPTSIASTQAEPFGIALSTNNVCWADLQGGTIMAAPLDGGAPFLIASGQGGPTGVFVDATNAYWTNNTTGFVMSAPLGGGAPTTIASGSAPYAIVVDANSIYWTNTGDGTVMKATPK